MKKITYLILCGLILIGWSKTPQYLIQPYDTTISGPSQSAVSEEVREEIKLIEPLATLEISTLLAEQIDKIQDVKQNNLVYESYDVKTNAINDKSFVKFKELPGGRKLVRWSIENDEYIHQDYYLLDEKFNTVKWEIYESDKDTHYTGIREGNKLILEGKHNGKKVSKVVSVDGKPFYYNPKVGLRAFVHSDKNYIEFWSLRNDKLEKYKMKAIKKGTERIKLRGREFEVVKVYWAATGIGEKFFKRTYYFRKDDALFLTQEESNGWSMDLVIEQ